MDEWMVWYIQGRLLGHSLSLKSKSNLIQYNHLRKKKKKKRTRQEKKENVKFHQKQEKKKEKKEMAHTPIPPQTRWL
jgi:hypothetical protein